MKRCIHIELEIISNPPDLSDTDIVNILRIDIGAVYTTIPTGSIRIGDIRLAKESKDQE